MDDPSHDWQNVNSTDIYGTHVALLLQASQRLSIRVAGLLQHTNGDGDGTIDTAYRYQPVFGYLTHDQLPGAAGGATRGFQPRWINRSQVCPHTGMQMCEPEWSSAATPQLRF